MDGLSRVEERRCAGHLQVCLRHYSLIVACSPLLCYYSLLYVVSAGCHQVFYIIERINNKKK